MRLRLVSQAEVDVADAALWYEDVQAGLGSKFLDAVEATIATIVESPERFGVYTSGPTRRSYRQARVSEFPYTIVFHLTSDEIVVVAVSHTSREPGHWET